MPHFLIFAALTSAEMCNVTTLASYFADGASGQGCFGAAPPLACVTQTSRIVATMDSRASGAVTVGLHTRSGLANYAVFAAQSSSSFPQYTPCAFQQGLSFRCVGNLLRVSTSEPWGIDRITLLTTCGHPSSSADASAVALVVTVTAACVFVIALVAIYLLRRGKRRLRLGSAETPRAAVETPRAPREPTPRSEAPPPPVIVLPTPAPVAAPRPLPLATEERAPARSRSFETRRSVPREGHTLRRSQSVRTARTRPRSAHRLGSRACTSHG